MGVWVTLQRLLFSFPGKHQGKWFSALSPVFLQAIGGFLGYKAWKGMFTFVRNHQIVLQSGHTVLHSHQQWMKAHLASHPCQHLLLSVFQIFCIVIRCVVFPGGSVVKNPPANAGDVGLIPWSGRFPGGGNGNSFQHSCFGKSCGQRSLVGYNPWGLKELDMTEHTHTIDV